jgi:basic membrane protein A and related proteins
MSRPRELKVGVVLQAGGVEDPFNNAAYLGLARAAHDLSIRGRVLTPSPREGHVPSLSLLARQKYDLVIGTGIYMTDAVDAAAVKFPETTFALLDVPHDALKHRPENVQGIVFSEAEAGYLAGYLAARVVELHSGEPVISSIGGRRAPAVEHYIAGYEAGARRASPRVTTLNSYTDDFMDPAKGRSAALSQIANGSRVVFQVAGGCGLGALEAAKEQGIWGIGVDVDQSYLGPHVLTSAVKRLDAAVFETSRELLRGTLRTGGTSFFSLRNSGVGLGEISPEVRSLVLTELERITSQIIGGEIAMPTAVT